jgi:hypothetical protein
MVGWSCRHCSITLKLKAGHSSKMSAQTKHTTLCRTHMLIQKSIYIYTHTHTHIYIYISWYTKNLHQMDLQEVGGSCGDWMELAQNRDRWRALVGTVRNLRVPKMRGISWLAAEPVSFSRTLLHGVSKYIYKSWYTKTYIYMYISFLYQHVGSAQCSVLGLCWQFGGICWIYTYSALCIGNLYKYDRKYSKDVECENKLSNNIWGGGAALVQVFSKFLMHQLQYSLYKFCMWNLFQVHRHKPFT